MSQVPLPPGRFSTCLILQDPNRYSRIYRWTWPHKTRESVANLVSHKTCMQVPKKMSAQHEDLVKGINSVKDMVGRLEKEPNVVQMLQQIKVADNLHSRVQDCSMHAERPS